MIDGLKKATEITSLEDYVDYDRVCDAIALNRPKLADDIRRLVHADDEAELPESIEVEITEVLMSPAVYPSGCNGLNERQSRYERTRKSLVEHFLTPGQLPDTSIEVDGYIFNFHGI